MDPTRTPTEDRTRLKDSPVEHPDRPLGIRLVREAHGSETSRAPVCPKRDVRPLDRAGLPKQILEVLPLYVEREL